MQSQKKYKILLYSKPWHLEGEEIEAQPIIDGFELTTNRDYIDEAVAVIHHMPTVKSDDLILHNSRKRKGQLWVFWSLECELHYSWQYEPEVLNLFDIMATYKVNSDIPVLYLHPVYFDIFRKEPAPKTGLINAFISGTFDKSNRLPYLKELMTYIDVDSYGKILNNKSLGKDEGASTKWEVISSYKFTIAFENAIAKDYVTEKYYQPLVNGSVPIYLGAPNIEEFAPGNKTYINVESFSSVKALADYLLELDNDPTAYNEYLKWKTLPFKEGFEQKKKVMETDPLIRLCNLLKERIE
jgi:hypothetical protein